MSLIGAAFLADPSNSNVLRQSYVTGFLDVRGNAIIRTDASLSGNIGIGGAVSISNNIGMSGVINQLISIPLQGGFVYQQVNSADALTAIAQVATLNTLVVTGNAVATPALAPYSNPISGNVVTLGTASVNARLGGISNYVMGNLAVLSDVSLNTRLFLGGDASFGGKLSVSSDASFGGRISVGGDISVNGLSLGLGSQSIRTNTVFGNTALQKIQTSGAAGWINNTAVGYQSLLAAITPVNNTAVGSMSLAANTTGANNTAVGYGAGAFVSTGGNITCLGYNTGFSSGATQYNNSTALGYNATIGGSNQVVLGTAAESVIVAGNLAIGKTTTPGFALDVVGNAQFANDVSINGNLSVTGGLSVKQMQSQNIVNMTTTNYQLIVSEDISLNGKLFVSGDVSMGGNLAATSGSTANTYKNLYGKAPPTSVYGNLVVSPNSTNATNATWVNDNITWTSSSSTVQYNNYNNLAFNTTFAAGVDKWESASTYTSGTANSSAALTSNIFGQSAQRGEWLQIQSSIPLVMASYSLASHDVPNRLPKTFWIVGSNDGNNWFQIQAASCGATQYSSTTYTMSSTFLVNSASAQTSGAATLTTTINPPYTTSAFTYFRLIVLSIFSTTEPLVDIAEWRINFTVASQPGPSRTLLYMDPSNINQLDVSGSLGLINTNASTMTVTPNTALAVRAGWQNNNVTWQASASSYFGDSYAYQAFSTINNISTYVWVTGAASYTGTGGAYIGPTTANYTTVIQGGPGTIYGEWLQLQSNVPLIMNRYNFNSQYGAAGFQGRLPKVYYICGSNDGSTWFPIQYVTFTSTPVASSTVTTVSQPTAIYTINTITTQQTQNASTSVYCYSTSLNAYTYFRLVITSAIYTSTLTGASAFTGDGFITLFWYPNFSPATSAVSMALDVGLPNQLNVGGAMNVAGAMNVGGAMNVAGTLLAAGYVGIGTTAPTYALQVNSAANTSNTSSICVTDTSNDIMGLFSAGGYGNYLHIGCWNVQGSVSKNIVMQKFGGFVGIGNVTPTFPLHITATTSQNVLSSYVGIGQNTGFAKSVNTGGAFNPMSIYSAGTIYCNGSFLAGVNVFSSDERIKKNVRNIDPEAVTKIVRKLNPKIFNYIDEVNRGVKDHYGYIAQEVEECLPESVSSHDDYIPNIFETCIVSDNGCVITLNSKITTDFSRNTNGEPIVIQLIGEKDAKTENTIIEIIDDKKFRVKTKIDENIIFVFGQKVENFRRIDTNIVNAVGIACLKHLDSEVTGMKQQITLMNESIELLKLQNEELKAQLERK